MESLFQDVRYSLRTLSRHPGFFFAATLSLALGMGVNTAIFSAINSLAFRPLAVRDLDRTVFVYHSTPANADRSTSFPAFDAYRQRTDIFSETAAFSGARPVLMDASERLESVYAEPVTSSYFAIADVRVQLGHAFDRSVDDAINPSFTIVLSNRLWRRSFAADPAIVGGHVILNGRPFTVAGVTARGFNGLDPETAVDLWMPLTTWAHLVGERSRLTSEEHWITTIAKLKDGVSIEHAQDAIAVTGQVRPSPSDQRTKVRSVRDRPSASASETLAIGGAALAAGIILLGLACTNVANLVIARAAARQREMLVRAALGGSRGRLMRLWLIETSIVSAVAGAGGLLLASWILKLAAGYRPPTFIGHPETPPLPIDFHLDVRVFAFALGLSAVSSVVVGLISGLHSLPTRALQRRFAPGFNLRSAVLASQMALSLILLIPSGLFVRSWLHASRINPGFETANVLLLPISSNQSGVHVQKPPRFDQELIDRVREIRDVESVTAMDPVPLWFGRNVSLYSIGETQSGVHRIGFSRIGPSYFTTLRIRLLSGREFTADDDATAPPVVIVNEAMARQFWPAGAALGGHVQEGRKVFEVVGIAADAKQMSLADSPRPWIYHSLAQEPTNNPELSLAVKVTRDSAQLREAIQREVRALVPSWPTFQFRRLDEAMELQRMLPRTGATLLGALGVLGLLLAAVAIYGVTAYVVRQRTREIGIRLALGSPAQRLIALVTKQSMVVCAVGSAIGLAMAFGVTRSLSSVLVQVSPSDPFTYVVVPLSLAAVAFAASYLPARRVTRTNPFEALRSD